MMDYYDELKSKNDIVEVALLLGFHGKISGSCFQGDCPRHQSAGGRCLVLWPTIQAFKCFHCGAKGDVIDLVMLFKNLDHKGAVNFLADRAGMPQRGGVKDSKENDKSLKEKKLIEDMLTCAAGWYHEQLKNFPKIQQHLSDHYGFSGDIIEEQMIGIAPPGTSDPEITSDLASYLNGIPEFKGKLALSGLFTFKSPQGPFWDYFKGRIIFPYWKSGKVVYMIARATSMTAEDQYECYTDKDGTVRRDGQGKAQYIKYKKLRTHDPDDEKRKYLSQFIQNDTFMGEDSIRGKKEVIITEGAPDFISSVDKGFATLSPVTTRFRDKDMEKLHSLTKGAEAVYLINDNEKNNAGLLGALKTGKHLTKAGRNVYLVELPRPAGTDKIDLNEYFLNHSAGDLRALIKDARSVLEILINELPEDFLKALPAIKTDIAPLLMDLEGGVLDYFINMLRRRVQVTQKLIKNELELVRKEQAKNEASKKSADPEIEKAARALAHDELLVRKRIDAVNQAVVGERKAIAMYFSTLDSRLLPDDEKSPNVLALKNSGHFGSGKSFTLMSCLEIYPESGYFLITNGSSKSLYYLEEGLRHKALVVTEGFQYQTKNAEDSELVYVTRSLLSEGHVRYPVVEKDENGKLKTVDKTIEGPTSFITTTVMEKLEPQLEDRMFTIHPDESMAQTRDILTHRAHMKAGLGQGLDERTISVWKGFHELLKPVTIVVPIAPEIATYIIKGGDIPIATRRAFSRMLAVIQTIACAYQYQREQDKEGRVIANMVDYFLALQIVQQAFKETLGQESHGSEERLAYIRDNGPVQYKTMQEVWGISKMAVSSWVSARVREGVLAFCDEQGEEYIEERDLRKAKANGKAYVKVSENYTQGHAIGLPSPFELTGDPAWDSDGAMTKKYDLKLDTRMGEDKTTAVMGEADATLDETADSCNTESANGYEDEEIDKSIPGPEIIEGDQDCWLDAIDYAYSQ